MDYSRVIVFFHSGFTFRDFWFGISSPLPCSSISRSLLTPSSLKQSDSDGVLNLLQLSLCSSSSKAAWISSKGRWRPAGSEARGSKGSEESNYFTLHVRRDPRFLFFLLKESIHPRYCTHHVAVLRASVCAKHKENTTADAE